MSNLTAEECLRSADECAERAHGMLDACHEYSNAGIGPSPESSTAYATEGQGWAQLAMFWLERRKVCMEHSGDTTEMMGEGK